MPIYEFLCDECGASEEVYLRMVDRNLTQFCPLGHPEQRIYSVPVMQAWNQDRPFPNSVHFGDGKFPTKSAYESHLKANDMAETAIDGRNKSKVPRSMRG